MKTRFLGRTDLEILAGIPDVEAERKRSFDEGYRAGLLKAAEIADEKANEFIALEGYGDKMQAALTIAAAIRAAEKEK